MACSTEVMSDWSRSIIILTQQFLSLPNNMFPRCNPKIPESILHQCAPVVYIRCASEVTVLKKIFTKLNIWVYICRRIPLVIIFNLMCFYVSFVAVVSCRPTVRVLSPDDGKQSIVHVAQQLCRSVENKERSFKDINVSMLDLLLRGNTLCLCACVKILWCFSEHTWEIVAHQPRNTLVALNKARGGYWSCVCLLRKSLRRLLFPNH